jgi:hypothetical protein
MWSKGMIYFFDTMQFNKVSVQDVNDAKTNQAKEKAVNQTNQVFNIAEKVVMEFVAAFLEEEPKVIFKEAVTEYSEPLILMPLEDYKKHICVQFDTFITTDRGGDDRIAHIKDLLSFEKVREGIGFLLYCIQNVYASVLATTMINSKPLVNVRIALDTTNWVFYPEFRHEKTYEKEHYETMIRQVAQQFTGKEVPPNVTVKLQELVAKINAIDNATDAASIKEVEVKMNELFKSKCVLALSLVDVHKTKVDQMVKALSQKNMKATQAAPLQSIAATQYTDA